MPDHHNGKTLKTGFSQHPPPVPYVGLRPYKRNERSIFVGRDNDARFLTDKIFSARLTLFYSLSGLGKSSILRALVVPMLEEEESRVFYFDSWSGDDPLEALKGKLISLARAIGIPDAGAGAPNVSELAHMISSISNRSLILIFDQFEEMLIHGRSIDAMGDELSRIVRSNDMDVRILISMRQEFLAALEPFRQKILNLFKSTYMLENMDTDGVRAAIETPPGTFGKSCEPLLLDQLIYDLEQLSRPQKSASTSLSENRIELPMMQLVCSELWNASTDQKSTTLTLKLYKSLGGAKKILKKYIMSVMPRGYRDSLFTAQLLLYLAPPSGYKMTYSVNGLADVSTLDSTRISKEFQRLKALRILRTRQVKADVEGYELQHDAFIPILTPWRKRILKRSRRLKVALWAGSLIIGLIIISFGWSVYDDYREKLAMTDTKKLLEKCSEVSHQTKGGLHLSKRVPCETAFDDATTYLLWQNKRPESERLDFLKNEILINYKNLLPAGYGVDESGLDFMDEAREGWPLALHYSSERKLDEKAFNATWWWMANGFAQKWGIPVPRILKLVEETTYSKKSLKFIGADLSPLDLNVVTLEDKLLINIVDLPREARQFFNRNIDDWELIEEAKWGGTYYAVPRWSLPVWNVSGITATDGSGLTAFLLALKLQKHPDRLLTPMAVEFLLQGLEKDYSQIVAEAKMARGDRIRKDLIEWVKDGNSLLKLPVLLDMLAQYPEILSEDVPFIWNSERPLDLNGPWPQKTEKDKGETKRKVHYSYKQIRKWLPEVEGPVLIYAGKAIEQVWFLSGDLSPELYKKIELMRVDFYRRFGFNLPGLKFRPSSWKPDMPENAFQIEVFGSLNDPVRITEGNGLDELMEALETDVHMAVADFIDADKTCDLVNSLDPSMQKWLYHRYSLTDLKILIRSVFTCGDTDEVVQIGSIRHFDWLMSSLVFWTQIHSTLDLNHLTEDLCETLESRFQVKEVTPGPSQVKTFIRTGIDKLMANKPDAAMKDFKQVSDKDPDGSIAFFLSAYSSYLKLKIDSIVNEACNDPINTYLNKSERADIEDRLVRLPSYKEPDIRRKLLLCLYNSYPDYRKETRARIVDQLLMDFGSPDKWPPLEAKSFALDLLQLYDPLIQPKEFLIKSEDFLKSAYRRIDENECSNVISTLSELYWSGGAKNWCWNLMMDLAEQRPLPIVQMNIAYQLSDREHPENHKKAIELVMQLEKTIKEKKGEFENVERLLYYVSYVKANAMQNQWYEVGGSGLDQAEVILTGLISSPYVQSEVFVSLITIHQCQEKFQKARKLLDTALKKWPQNVNFHIQKIWLDLLSGDISSASRTADNVVNACGKNSDSMFIASLGQILFGEEQWQEKCRDYIQKTDHQYVDIVTLMLYSKLSGTAKQEARDFIEQRWSSINQETWDIRLAEGDEKVWREMLIGYYLGHIPARDIFGVLEDEGSFRDSRFSNLPMTRSGMLCEAYFYDALLARANEDLAGMKKSLQKVLNTGKCNYYEYAMAQYMLTSMK